MFIYLPYLIEVFVELCNTRYEPCLIKIESGNIVQAFILRTLHSRACLTVSVMIIFNIRDTRGFRFA